MSVRCRPLTFICTCSWAGKMALYRQINKTWQGIFKDKSGDILQRAITFRREPTILRVDRPTRLDRARALGYKAKQGVAVVRIKVSRGGMRHPRPTSGRRPKHLGVLKIKSKEPVKGVAERRVLEKFPNMRILGSYPVWRDGKNAWFECVLIDPSHPAIRSDYNFRRALGLVG
jgi:large subunit ribosomal protein L15e